MSIPTDTFPKNASHQSTGSTERVQPDPRRNENPLVEFRPETLPAIEMLVNSCANAKGENKTGGRCGRPLKFLDERRDY
jgi:hypothetical protein